MDSKDFYLAYTSRLFGGSVLRLLVISFINSWILIKFGGFCCNNLLALLKITFIGIVESVVEKNTKLN
jgi:hypothetical protein